MSGPLRTLCLAPEYRSDSSKIVEDFYLPCLQSSNLYRRAVGYFTSRGLSVAAQGISALVNVGGQMRLVASPLFSEDDLGAIEQGYLARQDAITKALLKAFDDIADELTRDRLSALAWLIAEGLLEIRVAVPIDAFDQARRGIYHEKLGLFSDAEGNTVAFTGSPNETSGGLVDNFEAIDVFCSWDDPKGRVARKVDNFERLWANNTRGLSITPFPDAARERLLQFRKAEPTQVTGVRNRWCHQDEAIEAFLTAERGILEMATGTGKTRTALRICEHLVNSKEVDTIVVSADGLDLLDQWYVQLLSALPNLTSRFVIQRHYGPHYDRDRFMLDPRFRILLASRPALAPALRSLTARNANRTLLIHDEVHRLGSPANRISLAGLSDRVRYRLGLSATPEREYDQEGTLFVENHVGPIIFRFGLAEAIRKGILAPFTYSPIAYDLTEDDRSRLQDVYRRAEARERSGDPMSQEEIWIELARVHKTSLAKLPLFNEFLRHNAEILERCLIFVETKEYGDEVLRLVHRQRHDFHTYYSGEDSETLRRFARGEIQCLITCHRLSEGIDIKSIASVVLFSSARAPLETIQRMGRCLRTDPANPRKRARVVDFIRNDPNPVSGDTPNADSERRDWLTQLSVVEPEEI